MNSDPMNTETDRQQIEQHLGTGQRVRQVCLTLARDALAEINAAHGYGTVNFGTANRGRLPQYRDIDDLLAVARYIETGEHPMDPYRTGPDQSSDPDMEHFENEQ